jgi:hypothetical protein
MDMFNIVSIEEAYRSGACDKCVSYYPGEITPPFTTRCHSTIGRVGESWDKCTKRNIIKKEDHNGK